MQSRILARIVMVLMVADVEGFQSFLAPSARSFALYATSDGLTVPMLKEKCRALGLKVSGTKAELIERLNSGSSSRPKPAAVVPPRAPSTPADISNALDDVLPATASKSTEASTLPNKSPVKRKGGKVHA